MKKAFFIIATVAILGIMAAYANPLGPEANGQLTTSQVSPATDSAPTKETSQAVGYKDGTYQGGDYASQYGDVQVSVTIEAGKIIGVNFDQLTAFDDHSRQINNFASPRLKSQALASQSASIDGVSGATYTSQDYIRSLQSALDKARA